MIPERAVQAAAAALWNLAGYTAPWTQARPDLAKIYRARALAALEAAADHLTPKGE